MSVLATRAGEAGLLEGTIAFDGFAYAYPDCSEPALASLDVVIAPGEFVLVCGDSGSGKSTLLRAVSGLVPHHFGGVVEGSVTICGRDLRDHGAGELAAVCGTLLQDPETQIVMDSVRAEIAFPLENLGWERPRIALAVEQTAAALGIEGLLDRRTDALSGGELQRVALAAALATGPRVLVLDEPTAQLDPVAADDLLALLARICHDHGTTIVLAEHRLDRALEYADRVLMFADGRLAIDAEPHEFLVAAADDPRSEHLLPPLAELFARAGIVPLPVSAREAREALLDLRSTSQPSPDARSPLVSAGGESESEARESHSLRSPKVSAGGESESEARESHSLRPPKVSAKSGLFKGRAGRGGVRSPKVSAGGAVETEAWESHSLRSPKVGARSGLFKGRAGSDSLRSPKVSADGGVTGRSADGGSTERRAGGVLRLRGVGHSYRGAAGPALDCVDLELRAGEAAVLLGANGSGKSTLLRIAHGVQRPTHGNVWRPGKVALLLQNPNDYLIHERVADEAPAAALERFGLADLLDRDPRDLSGGQRQRLALAIVMQDRPVALLLDEPTRGMDAARRKALAAELRGLSAAGVAVLVATHDTEFAAQFAQRAIVMGAGRVIADGPSTELLGGASGGWFSTAVARLLPGSGALTPADGARGLA